LMDRMKEEEEAIENTKKILETHKGSV
jgi:hypothetical protein